MGSSSRREVLSGGWLSSSKCRCLSLEPFWQTFSTRMGRCKPCKVSRLQQGANSYKVTRSEQITLSKDKGTTWTEQSFTRTTFDTASPTSSLWNSKWRKFTSLRGKIVQIVSKFWKDVCTLQHPSAWHGWYPILQHGHSWPPEVHIDGTV